MYEIQVREEIDILHKIQGEDEMEGILHEHHLIIGALVELPSPEDIFLPMRGIVDIVEREITKYDSMNLNNHPSFQSTRVLIEDLARILFEEIDAKLVEIGLNVSRVEIGDARDKVKIIYHH
ncbi:6-carboxytetrahydropterin synthase [bacterium]|nr:6-carboxytetrahydropterin synthase [candidate division CSSED10-310 bacterium]